MSQKREGVWLYEPIKKSLEKKFKDKFGNCYLEIPRNRKFTNEFKNAIPRGYGTTLLFIGRMKAPDIVGFVEMRDAIYGNSAVLVGDKKAERKHAIWHDFIVVEVKNREISLNDVNQARNYGLTSKICFSYVSTTYSR